MRKNRSKKTKRCSEEGCNRIIRHWNKSGLCHNHYKIIQKKKNHKLWEKNHKCFDCSSNVEPVITYPAGDIIPPTKKYPTRCYECRKKILLTLNMKNKQSVSSSYTKKIILNRRK